MSDSANRPASARVNAAIRQLLEQGGIAALATIVEGPSAVGAKLLVKNTGEASGDLGDAALNSAVKGFARPFITRASSMRNAAPALRKFRSMKERS